MGVRAEGWRATAQRTAAATLIMGVAACGDGGEPPVSLDEGVTESVRAAPGTEALEPLSGVEPALEAEARAAIAEREAEERRAEEERAALAAANLAEAEAYLAGNAASEGITVTDSGLQYRVLEDSGDTADARPTPGQFVCVHYRGTLIDGTEFDSSYGREQAAMFPLGGVIPGFSEALQLMDVGDRLQAFIPPALGYGEAGAGDAIGPNAALIFEIELFEALDRPGVPPGGDCLANKEAAAANLERAEAFLAENAAKDGVIVTDTGLQYRVVAAGDVEREPPTPGEFVCVHYRGTLIDGAEFDSSYARGQPAAFPSDRLIPAWVEALALMRPGATWELAAKPELAYGRPGAGADIGPNEALLFTVELIDVLDGPPADPTINCATGEPAVAAEPSDDAGAETPDE